MILYNNTNWFRVAFVVTGTVWPSIVYPFAIWVFWMLVCYGFLCYRQENLGTSTSWDRILGIAMSFLLIFRANQASSRYAEGQIILCNFYTGLRQFCMFSTLYIYGGPATHEPLNARDPDGKHTSQQLREQKKKDDRARELRVDLIRLTIALACTFNMHTRLALEGYIFGSIEARSKWLIDWERFRLRQLLRDDEFVWVDQCFSIMELPPFHTVGDSLDALEEQFRCEDGPSAGPPDDWPDEFEIDTYPTSRPNTVIVFLIRELLVRNINDNMNDCCPWGIRERYIPQLFKLLRLTIAAYDDMDKVITTPLPLPYACLCKTLLVIFALSYPFTVDFTLGWFGAVFIPTIIALALLAIDAIATELENPFGPDPNDLDLAELVHGLECEAMEFLRFIGDTEGRARFEWRRRPFFEEEWMNKPVFKQLVFADFATEEVLLSPRSSQGKSPQQSDRSGTSGSGSQGSYG